MHDSESRKPQPSRPPRPKATKHDSRRSNLQNTLDLVSEHRATTRAELSRLTGLTRAAVSSLVGELIEDGLLTELGQGTSAGGKPPTLLALNAAGRDIVALDLGHRRFQGALVDLRGHIRHRMQSDIEHPVGDAAVVAATELIARLLDKAEAQVLGIGVGTPGVVEASGVVVEAANLDWHRFDLGSVIADRFGLPVSIANDAQVAALAELRRHPGSGESVLVVKLGQGVGAGVVLDSRLHRGENSSAGEIGHVQVVPDGLPCSCGNLGCLESVASIPAILRSVGADPEKDPWDALALSSLIGEEPLRDALHQAGRHLAGVLAHAAGLLGITRIVIAPEIRNAGEALIDGIRESLTGKVLPATAELIEVELSSLGADLVIAGAASAVLTDRLGVVLR
jgi:predicted NBD/HSP70 family sugar kinase